MKDLVALVEPDAIRNYVAGIWQTEIFRRSHASRNGYVRRVVEQLTTLPRLFCEFDDPTVERSHFFAWMGIIPHRHEYRNPAISDLYYLHEFLHATQMRYTPNADHSRWSAKIWSNERDASLGSEVHVYFELRELRPLTFEFEIWADRLLASPRMVELHESDPAAFALELVELRERTMYQPNAGDRVEELIASYHRLNVAWAQIWASRYAEVEQALCAFEDRARQSRADAADWLCEWALARQGSDLCPYEPEARAFARVVRGQLGD